jgi:hypothetical protein
MAQTAPAITKLYIMPGPAFWAAAAVSTKIPDDGADAQQGQLYRTQRPVQRFLLSGCKDRIE